MFSVKMVADSISNSNGQRISSMEVVFPRIVLAELNTHRMLTRNSASSRAIPSHKMIDAVMKNPFIPMKWLAQHTGMQGTDIIDESSQFHAAETWLAARDYMIQQAKILTYKYNVSKQIANRLLEPFMWHKALITATEWENYFALRHDPAAENHIQRLAQMMLDCMNTSKPTNLAAGEWHIPYGESIKTADINMYLESLGKPYDADDVMAISIQASVAKCAQTSYTIMDEEDKPLDIAKMIKLHDRLSVAGHWSPFEHIAQNMTSQQWHENLRGYANYDHQDDISIWDAEDDALGWSGNFRGWIQYRKTFKNENRTDDRLIKHSI